MNTIEEIISNLRIAMTDARQNESHFESWMILNEAICDAIDALTAPSPQRKPLTDELKDAFFDGFTSVVTYNDTWQNSPEEAWDEYKAAHGIKE